MSFEETYDSWTRGRKSMVFTDDDLKRLKEDLFSTVPGMGLTIGENTHIGRSQLLALLARLQAAERVCNGLQQLCSNHPEWEGSQGLKDLEAWRKVCGK